jgi:hypothetical protein
MKQTLVPEAYISAQSRLESFPHYMSQVLFFSLLFHLGSSALRKGKSKFRRELHGDHAHDHHSTIKTQ